MQQAISSNFARITSAQMQLNSLAMTNVATSPVPSAPLDLVTKLAYHSRLSGWLVFIDPPAHLDHHFLTNQGVDCRKILVVHSSKTRSKERCLALALESIHTRLVICDINGLQGTSLKTLKQAAQLGMGSAILLDSKDMAKVTRPYSLH